MWRDGKFIINGIVYEWCAKVYDEPSEYGINNGRVSKLEIRKNNRAVLNYDRGWDIKPDNDADIERIYRCIMCMFDTKFQATIKNLAKMMHAVADDCDTITDSCKHINEQPTTEDTLNDMLTLCESIKNTTEEVYDSVGELVSDLYDNLSLS